MGFREREVLKKRPSNDVDAHRCVLDTDRNHALVTDAQNVAWQLQ